MVVHHTTSTYHHSVMQDFGHDGHDQHMDDEHTVEHHYETTPEHT